MTTINLSPISASAAVTHHFSLTPSLWPPHFCPLHNHSLPLTTSHSFTWPMELFGAPSRHALTCVWGGASVLSVSLCPLTIPSLTSGDGWILWGQFRLCNHSCTLTQESEKFFLQEACKTYVWQSHLSAPNIRPRCDSTSWFRVLLL